MDRSDAAATIAALRDRVGILEASELSAQEQRQSLLEWQEKATAAAKEVCVVASSIAACRSVTRACVRTLTDRPGSGRIASGCSVARRCGSGAGRSTGGQEWSPGRPRATGGHVDNQSTRRSR